MSKKAGEKDLLIKRLTMEIAVKDEIILEFLKIATAQSFVLPKSMTDVMGALYYSEEVDDKTKKVVDFATAKKAIEGNDDKERAGNSGKITPERN